MVLFAVIAATIFFVLGGRPRPRFAGTKLSWLSSGRGVAHLTLIVFLFRRSGLRLDLGTGVRG